VVALADRIEDEAIRLCGPHFADILASQCFQTAHVIVRGHAVGVTYSELLMMLILETLDVQQENDARDRLLIFLILLRFALLLY